MVEGTAEYKSKGAEPYRVYLNEETLKKMDRTFAAKPLYVGHVNEVDLSTIQENADGWVIESFFNQVDGRHWAKFIVVSDRGHQAILNKWKLSNAYIPLSFGSGGLCHGVEYTKEITMAEYEHLAIVPDPRYEESIILTPEEFKSYNESKELDLLKVANSKGEPEMSVFKFFKKEKMENSSSLENTLVTLPESKKDVSVSEALEIADKFLNMMGYANGDHMVKVGEEEMSVNQLTKAYNKMKNDEKEKMEAEEKKKNADGEEAKKKAEDEKKKKENDDSDDEMMEDSKKKNADEEDEKKKKENAEKEAAEKKENDAHFNSLFHAQNRGPKGAVHIELSSDRLARGKERY